MTEKQHDTHKTATQSSPLVDLPIPSNDQADPVPPIVPSKVLFGMAFNCLSQSELAQFLTRSTHPHIPAGLHLLYTTNMDHLGNLGRSKQFYAAYKQASIRTIDGAPLALWAKLRGKGHIKRVPGADIFPLIMEKLSAKHHRPFFISPNEKVAEHIILWLVSRGFKREEIDYYCPEFGFERDPQESKKMIGMIMMHRPSHLFMGLGSPKSEIWLSDLMQPAFNKQDNPPICYGLAVGASLEFFTGDVKRAPKWMRQCGLEWMHRLFSDPKRLAKRYLIGSWRALKVFWRDIQNKPPQ